MTCTFRRLRLVAFMFATADQHSSTSCAMNTNNFNTLEEALSTVSAVCIAQLCVEDNKWFIKWFSGVFFQPQNSEDNNGSGRTRCSSCTDASKCSCLQSCASSKWSFKSDPVVLHL